MFHRKLLFSVFNTALKSYSSKLVTVGNNKLYINCLCISNNSTQIPLYHYSTTEIDVVTYEDIKQVPNKKNTLLIDVREPSELLETGHIPGSINIPLDEVESAFKSTTDDNFLKKYGKPKPNENDTIICSCRSGKRSGIAQNILRNIGYSNVRNYLGGWIDWETKQSN